MRLLPKLSRQARMRKYRYADNHQRRWSLHRFYVAHGYKVCMLAITDKGRIYRYYTRETQPVPLSPKEQG